MYVKNVDDQLRIFHTPQQIQMELFPDTSFPGIGLHEFILSLGFEPVQPTPAPPETFFTRTREVDPIYTGSGWVQHWETYTVEKTQEQIDAELSRLFERAMDAIADEKSRALSGGFYVGEVLFDSDTSARIAYQELYGKMLMDPTYSVPGWKSSRTTGQASTWVVMDAALFAQLRAAGEQHMQRCFMWQAMAETMVAAMRDAGDLAGLESFTPIFNQSPALP